MQRAFVFHSIVRCVTHFNVLFLYEQTGFVNLADSQNYSVALGNNRIYINYITVLNFVFDHYAIHLILFPNNNR